MNTNGATCEVAPAKKPVITALEADRREAIARHEGAQAALAQGGDPAAIAALMKAPEGHPVVMGHPIGGIHGGSYTAAFLVTSGMLADKFKTESRVIASLVELLMVINPRTVFDLLCLPNPEAALTSAAQQFAFDSGFSVTDINAFNRRIIDLTQATQSPSEEEDENFRKPAEPATTSPG